MLRHMPQSGRETGGGLLEQDKTGEGAHDEREAGGDFDGVLSGRSSSSMSALDYFDPRLSGGE